MHEVWQNQRFYDKTNKWVPTQDPDAQRDEDPLPWTNRVLEPAFHSDSQASSPADWNTENKDPPSGWEWVDLLWKVDAYHSEKCVAPDGWLYAESFKALGRNLTEGLSVGEKERNKATMVCRWRRWVRRRKRSDGVDEAREEELKQGEDYDMAAVLAEKHAADTDTVSESSVPKREFKPGAWGSQSGRVNPKDGKRERAAGGLAQEVYESDIVCEGWLRQKKAGKNAGGAKAKGGGDASSWCRVYAILVRSGRAYGVGTMVLVNSFEATPYQVLGRVEGGPVISIDLRAHPGLCAHLRVILTRSPPRCLAMWRAAPRSATRAWRGCTRTRSRTYPMPSTRR